MRIEEELKELKFRDHYQRVVINLLFTSNWMQTKLQLFFKEFDITPQQFNILRILRGQHPNKISGAEIKSRMLDKNSDMPRLIDRLLKKDLVIKSQCPSDKRAAEILISENGLALLSRIDIEFNDMERSALGITEQEALQLSNLLDKCRAKS